MGIVESRSQTMVINILFSFEHDPLTVLPDPFPFSLFTTINVHSLSQSPELEFLKSLWGLGTEEEEGYRTGPPGYIGWRNLFLGIDSWAP